MHSTHLINICLGSGPESHLALQSWGRDLGVWGPLSRAEAASGPGHSPVTCVLQGTCVLPLSPQQRTCGWLPPRQLVPASPTASSGPRQPTGMEPKTGQRPCLLSHLSSQAPCSPATLGPGEGESAESVSFSTEAVPRGPFVLRRHLTPWGTRLVMCSGGRPAFPVDSRSVGGPHKAPGASGWSLHCDTSENQASLGPAATARSPRAPLPSLPRPQRSRRQQKRGCQAASRCRVLVFKVGVLEPRSHGQASGWVSQPGWETKRRRQRCTVIQPYLLQPPGNPKGPETPLGP